MANSKPMFADIHCHSGARPWYNSTGSMWEAYYHRKSDGSLDLGKFSLGILKGALRKMLNRQKKGARAGSYDQSGLPKVLNGNVRLICASLYPLEKGFLLKKPFYVEDPATGVRKPSPNPGVRSFLVSITSKYPASRIHQMAFGDYWQQFCEEYNLYRNDSLNHTKKYFQVGKGSETEIREIFKDKDFGLKNTGFKGTGSYTIMDGANSPSAILSSGSIITALTMEGIGMVTQQFHAINNNLPLKLRSIDDIMNKLWILKNKTPVFFITFCHHMDNGVCGHARSMAPIVTALGVDQKPRINKGFTPFGMRILEYLLSVEKDEQGNYRNCSKSGRRILIDLKHMSVAGRQTVIRMVENFNKLCAEKDRIPLIASHSGYSGLTEVEMVDRIENHREEKEPQTSKFYSPSLKLTIRYNTWSLNLYREEIRAIVKSDGLIGLSLVQNVLGVPFGTTLKASGRNKFKETRRMHTKVILAQLCRMAEASQSPHFWKCISIGTDFDGLINPADGYPTAMFFGLLREDLIAEMKKLPEHGKRLSYIPDTHDEIEALVDDFCFNNALKLVEKYYARDGKNMPDISQIPLTQEE